MFFHARRLRADLRGAKRWLAVIAAASFAVSAVTTYLASFGLADIYAGTLSTRPPEEPLSFLRVADPDDSIARTVDDPGELNSGLQTPGLAVLLDRMSHDDRMYLTLPLGAFMSDRAYFQDMASSGLVVVGRSPAFLRDISPDGPGPFLWGSIPRGVPGLSDNRIGPVAVRRASATPPSRSYVQGSGLRRKTGNEAVLQLPPGDARTLGVSVVYSASDIADAFTCRCGAEELAGVARTMTQAERASGSHRVFYAVPYDGLVGPVERSTSAFEVLGVVFAAGTLLGVSVFAAMAVLLFWKRREHDYAVEQRSGAAERALQLRQQVIIATGVTFPVAAGFLLVDAVVRADQPVPWPRAGGSLAPLALVALHLAVGTATVISVHRLYRRPERGS